MTTYVFEFCNLYIPEDTVYTNNTFNIRIEPENIAEEFEKERRDPGSRYRTDYWHTATCYIEADKDRAEQLAQWLTFIYSFAQHRDVTWHDSYTQSNGGSSPRQPTYTFSLDNTNLRLIKGVWGSSSDHGTGKFIDTALQTLDTASDPEQSRIIRNISLFLEANGDTYWSIKFLLHWIVLESNANYNYDNYLQGPGEPIFAEDEIETLSDSIVDYLQEEGWDPDQVAHMEYLLGQQHYYEASSKTKIKIYLEYLNIGFDIEEIEEILEMARSIRNPIVHRNDQSRLMNNDHVVVEIRKIVFYVLLRLLGVDKEMQERLITPTIMGPDIERD